MVGVVDLGQIGLGPLANARDARALLRLHAHNAHRRVLLFQELRDTGNSASGTHGAHKMRHLPLGIGPDLGACGFVMDTRVVGVGKLIQHAPTSLGLHLLRQIARVLHAATLGREDQFGTKSFHGLGPLNRQVLGHDQNHPVAFDRRSHGQRNAGVTAGSLDERVARLDVAPLLRAGNHRQRGPVFHRARGVVAFELAQDHIATRAAITRAKPLQADQRRFADDFI